MNAKVIDKLSRAFTLLEILIVLAIISTLFVMIIPLSSYYRGNIGLDTTSNMIVSDLYYAKGLALNVSSHVSIDFNSDKYSLFKDGSLVKTVDLPKDVKCNIKTIGFSSQGMPAPGESGTILLSNKDGKTKSIIVSSMGRIRME